MASSVSLELDLRHAPSERFSLSRYPIEISAESELRLAGVYRSTGALKSAVYTNRALSALCVHPGTCTGRLARPVCT